MSRIDFQFAGLRFVFCFLCIVFFGFAAFGPVIFDNRLPYFQFIGFGLIVALFAGAIPVIKPWQLILLGIVAYIGAVFSAGSETSVRLIRDAVGVVSVITATGLGILVNRLFPSLPVGKFVLWAAIFTTTQILAVLILSEIQSVTINPAIIPIVVKIGALIGAGAGFGFELASIVAGRLWNKDKKLVLDGPTA